MQGFGNCKYGSMAREVLRLGVNLVLTATGAVALQSRRPGLDRKRLACRRRGCYRTRL